MLNEAAKLGGVVRVLGVVPSRLTEEVEGFGVTLPGAFEGLRHLAAKKLVTIEVHVQALEGLRVARNRASGDGSVDGQLSNTVT